MASGMYDKALDEILTGTWGLEGDDIRCLLLKTGYTFAQTHLVVNDLTPASYEITVTNYARQALTGEAVATGSEYIYFDAGNPTFSNLGTGETIVAAVIYRHVTTDADHRLIAYIDTGSHSTGGDFEIVWNANGIFRIDNTGAGAP